MKTTIKLAALGAVALAATSTAALATSELGRGITTGLAVGAPLPEGVYDISIASYGSAGAVNSAYALPVWLIWSTPWQIAGGRISLDTVTSIDDLWRSGSTGTDSFGNTLVDAGIGWNFGNGFNASLHAGAWLPSTQTVPTLAGRDYAAFQGIAAVSFLTHEWNLSATAAYGAGGNKETVPGYPTAQQADWFNLDLTAIRKFGKLESGVIAYGSWDLSNSGALTCYLATGAYPPAACKQHQFAVGSLVGYDFGAFRAQFKLTTDIAETNYAGKETRGWLTIIKPLWVPAMEGPLK